MIYWRVTFSDDEISLSILQGISFSRKKAIQNAKNSLGHTINNLNKISCRFAFRIEINF